jgi:transcriptional regulator NrdR family protein
MDDLRQLEAVLRQDIDKLRYEAEAPRSKAAEAAQKKAVEIDVDAVADLVAQIIPSLEAGEVNDVDLMSLRDHVGAEKMKSLLDAVADFNFATAVRAARALLDGLGREGVQG